MIGQKKAVVDSVLTLLPGFVQYKDIALVMLTRSQLESLKTDIGLRICQGLIEYGKDKTNQAEVMSYARNMVMNHLKKAKELNGNAIYSKGTAVAAKEPKNNLNIDRELLTEDLKEFVDTL